MVLQRLRTHSHPHPLPTMSRIGLAALLLLLGAVVQSAATVTTTCWPLTGLPFPLLPNPIPTNPANTSPLNIYVTQLCVTHTDTPLVEPSIPGCVDTWGIACQPSNTPVPSPGALISTTLCPTGYYIYTITNGFRAGFRLGLTQANVCGGGQRGYCVPGSTPQSYTPPTFIPTVTPAGVATYTLTAGTTTCQLRTGVAGHTAQLACL